MSSALLQHSGGNISAISLLAVQEYRALLYQTSVLKLLLEELNLKEPYFIVVGQPSRSRQ